MTEERMQLYWKKNLNIILVTMTIWFAVSLFAGVLIAEPLYSVKFFGVPLSFWFAQQGSIIIFIGLIYYYCKRMDRLDEEFGVGENMTKKQTGKGVSA